MIYKCVTRNKILKLSVLKKVAGIAAVSENFRGPLYLLS